MTAINLLPWREEKREIAKKQFNTMLIGAAVLAVGVVFSFYTYTSSLVSNQTQINTRLTNEITILDGKIKQIEILKKLRAALISRMKIVQNLQATRTLTVHLFDELIKVLPPGVYLTELDRIDDQITLLGYAESNTNISLLMRHIQNNPWIQTPVLTEIKKNSENKSSVDNQFKLNFILKPKTAIDKIL